MDDAEAWARFPGLEKFRRFVGRVIDEDDLIVLIVEVRAALEQPFDDALFVVGGDVHRDEGFPAEFGANIRAVAIAVPIPVPIAVPIPIAIAVPVALTVPVRLAIGVPITVAIPIRLASRVAVAVAIAVAIAVPIPVAVAFDM